MSYLFLANWNLTPNDLGVSWDEVDPAWRYAMLAIESGVSDGRRTSSG
jgi:hypothetical protein